MCGITVPESRVKPLAKVRICGTELVMEEGFRKGMDRTPCASLPKKAHGIEEWGSRKQHRDDTDPSAAQLGRARLPSWNGKDRRNIVAGKQLELDRESRRVLVLVKPPLGTRRRRASGKQTTS